MMDFLNINNVVKFRAATSYKTDNASSPSSHSSDVTNGSAMPKAPEDMANVPVVGKQEPSENGSAKNNRSEKDGRNFDRYECQTCKNRTYKDVSDDPGVSFKTPSNVSPERASTAVRSHEYEHVSRERSKALKEGREVVSQSVTYSTGICPECGTAYVSGGTTRTVTKGSSSPENSYFPEEQKGRFVDAVA